MLIAIIGESCVGKSRLAEQLKESLDAQLFSGRDYLRLAKNEAIARKLFQKKLAEAVNGENILYVISEREHLGLFPEGGIRVLMTADMDRILERFSVRMGGTLPPMVKQMLEKKHGVFDDIPCTFHIHNNENMDVVCQEIINGKQ